MATSSLDVQHGVGKSEANSPLAAMRFDAPHPIAGSAPAIAIEPAVEHAAVSVAEAARTDEFAADQLQLQAQQLAEFLRTKQRELDQREVEMNRRVAQLDNEARKSRLLLRERDEEFAQREMEYEQRIAELEQRAAEIAAAELAVNRDGAESQQQLAQISAELQRQRADLAEKEQRLAAEAAALVAAQSRFDEERAAALAEDQAEVRLRARERQIVETETYSQQQWETLERERRELAAERQRFAEETRRQELADAQQRKQFELDCEAKTTKLREWDEHLHKQQVVAEQLRAEVARMHQESLELRFVTEQLWSQLATQVDGPALTSSLAQLRQQLADEYRLTQQTVVNEKRELQELSAKLLEQQSHLRQQRQEMQDWIARRHDEIEERISKLIAREQDVAREQTHVRNLAGQIEQERRGFQKQVRELRGQLRSRQPVAA